MGMIGLLVVKYDVDKIRKCDQATKNAVAMSLRELAHSVPQNIDPSDLNSCMYLGTDSIRGLLE